MEFIRDSRLYGLFPSDYHFLPIRSIRDQITSDTGARVSRLDAVLWSKADLLITNGILQLISDVRLGRLPWDSVTGEKDTVIGIDRYLAYVDTLRRSASIHALVGMLEPIHSGYHLLKQKLKVFLDTAGGKTCSGFATIGKANSDVLQRSSLKEAILPTTAFLRLDLPGKIH